MNKDCAAFISELYESGGMFSPVAGLIAESEKKIGCSPVGGERACGIGL